MKIPSENYQFLNEQSLLVVTSLQKALIYKAKDGEIEKILEIDVDKEKRKDYFENVGVFKAGVKELLHHGRSLEDKQQKEREKRKKIFLKKLKKDIKQIKDINDFDSVYLFVPESIENGLKKEIPNSLKDRVGAIFYGNFVSDHKVELIKKIDSLQKEKKIVLTKEEAKKILDRGE